MTEKNQTVTVTIENLGVNGEGVATLTDGMKIFVPLTLPGEEADVRVLCVKKTFAFGKALTIRHASRDRVVPACPAFGRCGGCQLQHLAYEKQLEFKRNSVADTLKKVGHLDLAVAETVASPARYEYRNKIQLPVGVDKDGKNTIGFYRTGSHRIVDIDACPLHGEWATKLIGCVRRYMDEAGLIGYDEFTHHGDIRHIVARESNGRVLICLVTPRKGLPKADLLTEELKKEFDDFALLCNINTQDTNVILGPQTFAVYDRNVLPVDWQGIETEVCVESFLQVNPFVAYRLYDDVIEAARITSEDYVIDAYSGAGILSARLARSAKHVYGVELCGEASQDAVALAERNGIENLSNYNGDCAMLVPMLIARLRDGSAPGADGPVEGDRLAVVLDPPRKGCDAQVLSAVLASAPSRIVYVSCNPATLARDLSLLVPAGYSVRSVVPYDMFPETCHVETLVCLTRKSVS